MTEDEIWCPINGYEGLYEVSDKGRVKSLKFDKERLLKPKIARGYLQVVLCKNGEKKWYLVHRLVAKTFIPNPDNLQQVNHKDENKENNCVLNLEWCDRKYNCNYGTRTRRISEKHSKPVIQYTKSGELVKDWKSAVDVERNLGYHHQHISSCCTGKRKSANGFVWKYKD